MCVDGSSKSAGDQMAVEMTPGGTGVFWHHSFHPRPAPDLDQLALFASPTVVAAGPSALARLQSMPQLEKGRQQHLELRPSRRRFDVRLMTRSLEASAPLVQVSSTTASTSCGAPAGRATCRTAAARHKLVLACETLKPCSPAGAR